MKERKLKESETRWREQDGERESVWMKEREQTEREEGKKERVNESEKGHTRQPGGNPELGAD